MNATTVKTRPNLRSFSQFPSNHACRQCTHGNPWAVTQWCCRGRLKVEGAREKGGEVLVKMLEDDDAIGFLVM